MLKKTFDLSGAIVDLSSHSLSYVANKYNISRPTLMKRIRALDKLFFVDRKNRKLNNNRYPLFNKIDNEISAYWLGFLYADGCVHHINNNNYKVALAIKDTEHLLRFRKDIGAMQKPYYIKNGCVSISIGSYILAKDLIGLGCVPRKSLILKFPTEEQVPVHLLSHFIRGYFDGDGSVYKAAYNSYYAEFIGTFQFMEGVVNILCGVGLTNISIRNKIVNKNTYTIRYSKQTDVVLLYKYLYDNATICLDRKRDRFLKFLELIKPKDPPKCSIDNCENQYHACGYCNTHYRLLRRWSLRLGILINDITFDDIISFKNKKKNMV